MIDTDLSLQLLPGDDLVQRTGRILVVIEAATDATMTDRLLGICARSSVETDMRLLTRRLEALLLDAGPQVPAFAVLAAQTSDTGPESGGGLLTIVHGPMQLDAAGPGGELRLSGIAGSTTITTIAGPLVDLAIATPNTAMDVVSDEPAPAAGMVRAGGIAAAELVHGEQEHSATPESAEEVEYDMSAALVETPVGVTENPELTTEVVIGGETDNVAEAEQGQSSDDDEQTSEPITPGESDPEEEVLTEVEFANADSQAASEEGAPAANAQDDENRPFAPPLSGAAAAAAAAMGARAALAEGGPIPFTDAAAEQSIPETAAEFAPAQDGGVIPLAYPDDMTPPPMPATAGQGASPIRSPLFGSPTEHDPEESDEQVEPNEQVVPTPSEAPVAQTPPPPQPGMPAVGNQPPPPNVASPATPPPPTPPNVGAGPPPVGPPVAEVPAPIGQPSAPPPPVLPLGGPEGPGAGAQPPPPVPVPVVSGNGEPEPGPSTESGDPDSIEVPALDLADLDARPDIPPVMVRGVRCARCDAHNHPDARYCGSCGKLLNATVAGSVDENGNFVLGEPGPRPPLGQLSRDDGVSITVDRDMVLGRAPSLHDRVTAGHAWPVALPDQENSISRIHAEVVLQDWDAYIIDAGSRNGTYVRGADTSEWTKLENGDRYPLENGLVIAIGDRRLTYNQHHVP